MNITDTTEPVFAPGVSFKEIRLRHGYREPWNLLPCAVSWCIGHTTNAADSWEELQHQGEDVPLFENYSRPDVDARITKIEMAGDDKSSYLKIGMEIAVTAREAGIIARQLRAAANKIEKEARR